jgi:hypothetical protein
MKTYLAAFALTAALAQPAAAITFPSLTTIYVASGVLNEGGGDFVGKATSIHCSNVSGVSVQVRALVLHSNGSVAGSLTASLPHGTTTTFSTKETFLFIDTDTNMQLTLVAQGVLNVEATNSAVFCTALVIDADTADTMSPLHLVRVNPHPGTVE